MKKLFTLIAALGITSLAIAQEEPATPDSMEVMPGDTLRKETRTSDDTTYIDLKNAKITIVNKSKEEKEEGRTSRSDKYELAWWSGIDIGVNGIMGDDYRTELNPDFDFFEPDYGKSRYIAFNVTQLKGRIIKDYVGITTGLGVQIYNYKFSGDNVFTFGDSLTAAPSGEVNISKNKLRASYLAVPVMLEFNTSLNPEKSFHISAGVVGKMRFENMYKQKFSFEGSESKTKLKGDLGLNRWGADAIVRVGYRKLTFFTQVGLLPLFDDTDSNPELYAFAAGLSLIF
jgi:hypothetical protein